MTDLEKVFEGKFLVPSSLVESLMFFREKYKRKNIHSKKGRLAIGEDIFQVCKTIFNNPEFCRVIRVYRSAVHLWTTGKVPKRINLDANVRFIKVIDELECFYDINSNAGGGIKDKRIALFVTLKGKLLQTISFLERRGNKMAGPTVPKNINNRLLTKKTFFGETNLEAAARKRKYACQIVKDEEKRILRRLKEGY